MIGLTYIFDSTSKAPKNIDVSNLSHKISSNVKVKKLQIKSKVLIYSHGGVDERNIHSGFILPFNGLRVTFYKENQIYNFFHHLFSDHNGILLSETNKVEELHLLSCHSGDTEMSVVRTISSMSNIKDIFPNLKKVVGIKGIIDQHSVDNEIMLVSKPTILNNDIRSVVRIGFSKNITMNGLDLDNERVIIFDV